MALDRRFSNGNAEVVEVGDGGTVELRKAYIFSTEAEILSSKESQIAAGDVEATDSEPVTASMETMALKALHVDDDPTLNPWTFRVFFLG